MPFLLPNQQRQSTEGTTILIIIIISKSKAAAGPRGIHEKKPASSRSQNK